MLHDFTYKEAWHNEWMAKHADLMSKLPADAHPQAPKHGEKNYTVQIGTAKIQIHLHGQYYISKPADGVVFTGSHSFRWSQH